MNVQKLVAAPLLAIALMCMNVTPAEAGVFSVTPVRIFMTPRDRAVAITLTNEGDSDVALQADIGVWGQKPDGTDEMQPTEDLLLAPPIIKLAPRQRQVVRLASLRAPDPARQLTYRMVIREVPEATAPKDGSMEVPIALALSMPVFITPPGAKREVTCDLGRGAAQAVLAVCTNSGNAYAQVREATIKRNNAELARFEGGAYVLPGVRRSIPLKAQEAVAAGPAQLNVVFDDGKAQVFEVTLP